MHIYISVLYHFIQYSAVNTGREEKTSPISRIQSENAGKLNREDPEKVICNKRVLRNAITDSDCRPTSSNQIPAFDTQYGGDAKHKQEVIRNH